MSALADPAMLFRAFVVAAFAGPAICAAVHWFSDLAQRFGSSSDASP